MQDQIDALIDDRRQHTRRQEPHYLRLEIEGRVGDVLGQWQLDGQRDVMLQLVVLGRPVVVPGAVFDGAIRGGHED